MSIGNLKTDGGKGTNWPWQYRMLKGLEGIINAINTTAEVQEYEAKVVNINCTGDPFTGDRLYLEVRVFNTDTGLFETPVYYLPGDDQEFPLTDFATCTITYPDADVPYTLGQKDMANSVPVTIANDQEGIVVTPGLLRTAVAGTVAAGARSVSIANVGAGDGEVLGETLAAGETITFDAGAVNNSLGAIAYDPTTGTTTFLIATLT